LKEDGREEGGLRKPSEVDTAYNPRIARNRGNISNTTDMDQVNSQRAWEKKRRMWKGRTTQGIGTPGGTSQKGLMRQALDRSTLRPHYGLQ